MKSKKKDRTVILNNNVGHFSVQFCEDSTALIRFADQQGEKFFQFYVSKPELKKFIESCQDTLEGPSKEELIDRALQEFSGTLKQIIRDEDK